MARCTDAAAVRLTIKFPFWCELFYSMDVIEVQKDDPLAEQIQTLATDGLRMWVNVDYFMKESLEFQVADLVHELSHKMFLHATRKGFRDAEKWNIACDYAINSLMLDNGFRLEDPNNKASAFIYDKQYHGWLAEQIYADLVSKERKGEPPPQMPAARRDLREPEGMTQEQVGEMEQQIQATVDRAVMNAHARGDLPSGVKDQLITTYKPADEPWYNHLHRYMQSLVVGEYNWSRLNRRTLRSHGFFSPHHYSEALDDVVIWIDASGSCYSRAMQANFAEHVNAIMGEAKPKRIVVYYFDTKCYPPEEFEPGLMDIRLQPQGGGGTSFRGLFDQALRDGYAPAVGIVLTDMEGAMPDHAPPFPVIWADIAGSHRAPFGEYLRVEA